MSEQLKYEYCFYRSKENNENRFFVEAGAFDGEIISNSLYFETKLGWSGVLIEPNPAAFNMLLTKHRKAWSINACLSRQIFPEIIEFDLNGIVGGIINKNGIHPGDLQVRFVCLKVQVHKNLTFLLCFK